MEYIEKLKNFTRNLEKCDRVTRHSTNLENQADTLANALLDVEGSFKEMNEKIPKLYLEDLTKDEVEDLILDIGEELRHILYHINDTRFFDYIKKTGI
jgi:hypothetical protein